MDRRPPAIFVGDAPALDFLNSIATPVDTPIDWIDDGQGYLSWLEQANLVAGDVLRDMRARALPGELDKIADQARSLREWFRGFVRQHKRRRLTAEALAELKPLNRLLERDESFGRIALSRWGKSRSSCRPCADGATPRRFHFPSERRWLGSSVRRTFPT
jgi:Putative stress-induced transcription regulator